MQDYAIQSPRTAPHSGPARFELYTSVHKGLRAAMSDALLAVGRMDCDAADEVAEVLARVRTLLSLCRDHLEHEERQIHPAMESRCPGAAAQTAAEHRDHLLAFVALEADVQGVERAVAGERAGATLRLYRRLAVFVAENFQHMHTEEVENTAILWQTHSDAELAGIHQAIVTSIPPERMAVYIRWMVPFLNPAERAALLGAMQANAPAPAFERVLGIVRPHLDARDWRKLAVALGRTAD
jgi:hypothetical protein